MTSPIESGLNDISTVIVGLSKTVFYGAMCSHNREYGFVSLYTDIAVYGCCLQPRAVINSCTHNTESDNMLYR